MRIWVTGAKGMLGRRVVAAAFEAGHDVLATGSECDIACETDLADRVRWELDAIINCAGVLPGNKSEEMARVNAYGPQLLAHYAAGHGARLVHMSTDCVFSGRPAPRFPGRRYQMDDPTDPIDIYGRTKLAGEPAGEHVVVVRGSFVGPEKGLMAWLLSQPTGAEIDGWANAWWTGIGVTEMARQLVSIAELPLKGVIHIASAEKVSKCELLTYIAARLKMDVKIRAVDSPWIDRALEASPGFEVAMWPTIAEVIAEAQAQRASLSASP